MQNSVGKKNTRHSKPKYDFFFEKMLPLVRGSPPIAAQCIKQGVFHLKFMIKVIQCKLII